MRKLSSGTFFKIVLQPDCNGCRGNDLLPYFGTILSFCWPCLRNLLNTVGGCPYFGLILPLFWPYFRNRQMPLGFALILPLLHVGLILAVLWPYFRNLQMPLGVALISALFCPYVGLISPYFRNLQIPLGVALILAFFALISALFWPYVGLISNLGVALILALCWLDCKSRNQVSLWFAFCLTLGTLTQFVVFVGAREGQSIVSSELCKKNSPHANAIPSI